MRPRHLLQAFCWVVLLSVLGLPAARAQDAQSDQAAALLQKGIEQYQAKDFEGAQATLLKVQRDKLPAAQRKQLDEHLANVRGAIPKQAEAMATHKDALAALKANDLKKAAELLQTVATSPFVTDKVSAEARQQRALVIQKMQAAEAAPPAKTVVTTVTPVQAVVTTQPAPQPRVVTTQPAPQVPVVPTVPARSGLEEARAQELQARLEKAKTYIALGNQALDNMEIDKAISYFKQAVAAAPEYEPAQIGLARAESLTGMAKGLSGISELEKRREVQRQRIEVLYAQAMLRARQALQVAKSAEDFAKAREEVNYAKTLISVNKSLFTEAEYRRKLKETDELLQFVDMEENKWKTQRVLEQEREVRQREAARRAEAERQRLEKIATYKATVLNLEKEHKFRQAVEVLERMQQLAPEDAWVAEMHERLGRFVLLLQDREASDIALEQETRQFIGVREAGIPWYELLRFPNDWPQIRESRKKYAVSEAAESAENRAVRRKLMETQRKLEFTGVPFEQVVEFMRDISGVSIHVKWTALEQAGVNRDTPVNVKLTDVTIEKALRTILDDVGGITPLDYVIDEGVITISTRDDLSRQTVTRVYDIRDLIIRVPNFEGPRIDLANIGNNVGGCNVSGTGGGGLFGNVSGNNYGTNNAGEENQISRQELINNILDLVRSTIAPDTWIERSGTIGSIRELGGLIVVTQTPQNQQSLVNLLEQLRETKTLQINIEARFIQVSTGFLNHVGIDLDFYLNLSTRLKPVNDGTGNWATDPITGARIVDNSPGAYLPQWENRGLISNRWTPTGFRQGSFTFAGPQQTAVPNSIGGTVQGSALSVAGTFLDDIQVDFLINATQAHQGTRTLTAPRLTIYNGQRAYVTVATQQAYVANVTPVVVENVAAFQPTIATVSTGTTLDVEGTVSADRKYVTMTIRPQVSTVNGFTEYQGAVDQQGNPIPGSGQIQLPNVTLQEVETTVTVPDGGTLLLGGTRLAGEVEREMGVPILAKIPVLNRAFSNRSIVRDEQALLILVKPKIIIHKEYEDRDFPE